MAKISTIPLFKNLSLSAGDSGTSDPIELRYTANQGYFSLFYSIAAGTFGTCGTTTFSYKASAFRDGVFVDPSSGGTFGTAGSATNLALISFAPKLTPWMKIVATQTGSGTNGADSKITAELNMQ